MRTTIKAGEQTINEVDIRAGKEYSGGKARETLCIESDQPLTEDQILSLSKEDWHLFEQDDKGNEVEVGVKRGYNAVHKYQTIFIQTETAEEREAALRQRIYVLEAEKEAVSVELAAAKASVTIGVKATDMKTGESV